MTISFRNRRSCQPCSLNLSHQQQQQLHSSTNCLSSSFTVYGMAAVALALSNVTKAAAVTTATTAAEGSGDGDSDVEGNAEGGEPTGQREKREGFDGSCHGRIKTLVFFGRLFMKKEGKGSGAPPLLPSSHGPDALEVHSHFVSPRPTAVVIPVVCGSFLLDILFVMHAQEGKKKVAIDCRDFQRAFKIKESREDSSILFCYYIYTTKYFAQTYLDFSRTSDML